MIDDNFLDTYLLIAILKYVDRHLIRIINTSTDIWCYIFKKISEMEVCETKNSSINYF